MEHRLFSFISLNWRGKLTHKVIVNLIAAATSSRGLRIRAAVDPKAYSPRVKLGASDLDAINLKPACFHGEWNCAVTPAVTTTPHK